MDPGTVLAVFVVIALAELPDKTMVATVLMGARGAPLWVWLGASAAFLVHVSVAVLAGQLLDRLPEVAIQAVVTCCFAGGAAWLLLVPERAEARRGVREAADERLGRPLAVAGSAFGVILLGELGDLSQVLTASFVARTHDPASVALGAAAALVGVAAAGAFAGRALVAVVHPARIRRIGGVVLLGFAIASLVQLVTG